MTDLALIRFEDVYISLVKLGQISKSDHMFDHTETRGGEIYCNPMEAMVVTTVNVFFWDEDAGEEIHFTVTSDQLEAIAQEAGWALEYAELGRRSHQGETSHTAPAA